MLLNMLPAHCQKDLEARARVYICVCVSVAITRLSKGSAIGNTPRSLLTPQQRCCGVNSPPTSPTSFLSAEEKNLPLTQCFNSEAVNFYFMSRSSGTFTLQSHFLPHSFIHPHNTHPQAASSSQSCFTRLCEDFLSKY